MSTPAPRERDLVKCEDMRIHAERAQKFVAEHSLDSFAKDELTQTATIRCIEVIGEAARLVSEETRKRAPEIPWPLIIGMRHVLAHDYGTVDLERVYNVVPHQLPDLLPRLQALIMALEKDTNWQK